MRGTVSARAVRRAHHPMRRAPDAVREGGVRTATGPFAFGAGVRAAPAPRGGAGGGGSAAGSRVVHGGAKVRAGRARGRARVRTGSGRSFVEHRPGCASPGATVSTGCGRPRASPGPTTPSDVTGLLSPADRSRHRGEVPRRGPRLAAGVSSLRVPPVRRRLRVVLQTAPGWRGTGNNEASRRPVTRRTGESATERRSGSCAGAHASHHAPRPPRKPTAHRPESATTRPRRGGALPVLRPPQIWPRDSSSSVIASAVPGLPSWSR